MQWGHNPVECVPEIGGNAVVGARYGATPCVTRAWGQAAVRAELVHRRGAMGYSGSIK
jgi:hypothetical protein